MEHVTGHVIPDFRPALKRGVAALSEDIGRKLAAGGLSEKHEKNYRAMQRVLAASVRLAHRYADLAAEQAKTASAERKKELALMEANLRHVPEFPAQTLMQAM